MDPAQLMFAYNHCSEYYHEFVPQPDAYVQYSETYSCDGFVQVSLPESTRLYFNSMCRWATTLQP